jgi:peptidoglycan-associated lipoprotein
MYSAAGGVPGLIAGAVINQLLCTPSDTTNSTEPKVLIDSALKTVSIKDAKTVYFDYDKYSLNENGKMDVRTTAAVLKTIPSIPIRIEGNADSRGSDEYNYALGLKRANAVKQALINEGVVNPLQIVSYGESQPTCTSSTEDCLSKNRRVEFKTVE